MIWRVPLGVYLLSDYLTSVASQSKTSAGKKGRKVGKNSIFLENRG